jgi:hypothetical protein
VQVLAALTGAARPVRARSEGHCHRRVERCGQKCIVRQTGVLLRERNVDVYALPARMWYQLLGGSS